MRDVPSVLARLLIRLPATPNFANLRNAARPDKTGAALAGDRGGAGPTDRGIHLADYSRMMFRPRNRSRFDRANRVDGSSPAQSAFCLLHNGSGGPRFMTMNAAEYVLLGGATRGGPDKLALTCAEERLTYGELLLRVGRFAAGLRAAGLGRLDRVAMLMLDTPDVVALHLATMAAGGIAGLRSGR